MTNIKEKREIKHKNISVTKPKIHMPKITAAYASKIIACILGGLIFSNPFVLGFLAPFACSLTAALSGVYSYAACFGSFIGAIVFSDGTAAAKYIAIPPVCLLLTVLGHRYLNSRFNSAVNCVSAFISPLAVGITVNLATGFISEELLMSLCEALLSASGAVVFSRSIKTLFHSKIPMHMTYGKRFCMFLSVSALIMSFYSFDIFKFSPAAIFLSAIILVSTRLSESFGGLIAGLCVGLASGLSGRFSFICIAFAASGLAADFLSRKGKFYTASGFLAVIAAGALIDGSLDAYMTVPAALISSITFAFIPDKVFVNLRKKLYAPLPSVSDNTDRKQLSQKLTDASQAIGKVCDCVGAVRKTLDKSEDEKINAELLNGWQKVCGKCDMQASCRDEIKNISPAETERLAYALRTKGLLEDSDFPKSFPTDCYCFDKMKHELENRCCTYLADLGAKGKVEQLHGLMSDQFRCVSDILNEIADEFNAGGELNSELSRQCSKAASEFGLSVTEASVSSDSSGKCCLELTILPPKDNFNVTALTNILSKAASTSFDLPELEKYENYCVLKFTPRAVFSVDIGAYSRSADDRQICGDYYQSFSTDDGKYITVLSDGMGTGSRAAVDSAMAAELFTKLIKSGLSFGCSLSVTNSALLVKSEEESLATLDALEIDLCSGKSEFYKAGAAASFIMSGDEISVIESSSLPIGILRDVNFVETEARLKPGDWVLMVSDGVISDGYNKIQQDMKLYSSSSPAEFAEIIVNNACRRHSAKQRDDMTAIAILIK